MALPQVKLHISPQDYLAFERQSEVRHEYDNGSLYSMAGESLSHSRINVNVTAEKHTRLKGKRCEALSPNMKFGVNGEWRFLVASGLDAQITFAALDVQLSLAEIYDRVEFPADADNQAAST